MAGECWDQRRGWGLETQGKEQTVSHNLLDGAHDRVKDPNQSYTGKSQEQKQIFMQGLLGPRNMLGDLQPLTYLTAQAQRGQVTFPRPHSK